MATTYTFAPLAGTAGLDNVMPTGINNAGTVIGVYGPGNQPRTGFVDQAGQVSSFPGNPLFGINDRGDIVGTRFDLSSTPFEQSTFTGPHAPGITLPDAPAGINNSVTVGAMHRVPAHTSTNRAS